MSKFTEKFTESVKNDTPRLVVMYQREDGHERFQWGIVGNIPILSLLGAIICTQQELYSVEWAEKCPGQALVIAYCESTKSFQWFIGDDIPRDSLVGMLETIKATITTTHLARKAAAQQVPLLGPDGRPFGGN